MPPIKAGQESVEKILEALAVWFVLARARMDAWIVEQGKRQALPQQDILDLIATETAYGAEFERKVRERVSRDAAKALNLPAPERGAAVEKMLRRERTYARQRSEAMAVRALSAIDRVALRRESPDGAYWKLDPDVKQHTPDCVAMGGRLWPWPVLDGFHPPTHHGCRCSLHAVSYAKAKGWVGKTARVLDLETARRKAAAARALLHPEEEEAQLVEAIVRVGLAERAAAIEAFMEAA